MNQDSEKHPLTIQDILDFDYDQWGEQIDHARPILNAAILTLLCEGQIARHTIFGGNVAQMIYSALSTRSQTDVTDVTLAMHGKEDGPVIRKIKEVLEPLKTDRDAQTVPFYRGEVREVRLCLVRHKGIDGIFIPFSGLPKGQLLIFREVYQAHSFEVVDERDCKVQPSTEENLKATRALCHIGIDHIFLCEEDSGEVPRGDIQIKNGGTILGDDESFNPAWVEISHLMMDWLNWSHRPPKQ